MIFYLVKYLKSFVSSNDLAAEISKNLYSFSDGFNEKVLEKISFFTPNIVSCITGDSEITRYLESYEPDQDRDSHGGYFSGSSGEDDIDAIFECSSLKNFFFKKKYKYLNLF